MSEFYKNLSEIFHDDKSQVILALTILGGMSLFIIAAPETIISNIVAGMLGIAIGKGGKA